MDKPKKLSKPNDIGYEPMSHNFIETHNEYKFHDGDYLTSEIIDELKDYLNKGFDIRINCGHDQNYRYHDDYEPCDIWTEITISKLNIEQYEKAKEAWKTKSKKYKKDLEAYQEFMKEEESKKQQKEERAAKALRKEQYLLLKEEFEGKK